MGMGLLELAGKCLETRGPAGEARGSPPRVAQCACAGPPRLTFGGSSGSHLTLLWQELEKASPGGAGACLAPRRSGWEFTPIPRALREPRTQAAAGGSLGTSMFFSGGYLSSSEQPNNGSLGQNNRNEKKNHTIKLRELALMLPISQKSGTKKLTKKEILVHVLHYIRYLQNSINVVQTLIGCHISCWEAGPTEEQDGPQMPRRSLDLHKPEEGETTFPDPREENLGVTATPPQCPDLCDHLSAVLPSLQDGGEEGIFQLVAQDLAENVDSYDFTNFWAMDNAEANEPKPDEEAQRAVETTFFMNKVQLSPRQMLISSEELDKEILESPQVVEPPQSNTWGAADYTSNNLALSPLFFSSPSKVLPQPILQDDTFYLTEGLLEDAFLQLESLPSPCSPMVPLGKDGPSWAPQELPGSSGQNRPFLPVDKCYVSLSDSSETSSGSTSEDTDTATDTESMWEQEEDLQADPEGVQSSSNEDDCSWTPTRQAMNPAWGRRTAKKNRAHRVPGKPKESKKASCPAQAKKKCVNGFIMFCRMNRKQYIRACPGTASTAATKELAQLWRMMSLRERRPYCAKARRFSRQHNRVVKQENSTSSEDEDWELPKPFCQLLAQRACAPPEHALPPKPHHQ
ncbi:meiosis initiator protein [Perognathus longimembris pacificus]|uniref:meiosis initiator protein n=1 Tax=Perognathus longimembris pacificus TaxID=214514 RepID=UPI002018C48F|nr:meiosis initiator protein [Perognathus longimembris pacificus]